MALKQYVKQSTAVTIFFQICSYVQAVDISHKDHSNEAFYLNRCVSQEDAKINSV